ncbi:FAD/NAD(P)-binding protein [Actinoplanes sp. NPDC026670]|uniref:FAD/NAD(P)-binding protein n=1 Tax=Actinoplanes sp. NPDC026670 TaxID=3154700 RepID=UPI0033F7AF27
MRLSSTTPGEQVVIIGCGMTGVSAYLQLVRHGVVRGVTLIDPHEPGFGPAFGSAHVHALCNTPAGDTSLLPDRPDDLCDYLRGRGWPHDRAAFVPRFQAAQYARTRFLEHRRTAQARGITTRHVRDRALRVTVGPGGGYLVHLASGDVLPASEVLVCVGLGEPIVPMLMTPYVGHPAFVPTPYPAAAMLRQAQPGGDVLVLGSRLSAIETALLLIDSGRRVVISSPSGELPAVRTRLARTEPAAWLAAQLGRLAGDLPDPAMDRAAARLLVRAIRRVRPLALRHQIVQAGDPHERLRRETALAETDDTPWQDVVAGVIDGLNEWLPQAGPARAAAFMKRHRSLISRYVSAIPLGSARRLLDAIDAGRLTVRTYPAGVEPTADGGWTATWDDTSRRFDTVVAAAGNHKRTVHVDGDALHLDGTPATGPLRPAADLRVVIRPPARERIWLVGPSTHGRSPITNYLHAAAGQAGTVFVNFLDQVGVSV